MDCSNLPGFEYRYETEDENDDIREYYGHELIYDLIEATKVETTLLQKQVQKEIIDSKNMIEKNALAFELKWQVRMQNMLHFIDNLQTQVVMQNSKIKELENEIKCQTISPLQRIEMIE